MVGVTFSITCFKWGNTNTICADLAHMRIVVTPSPLTPVTPRYKRVVDFDTEYPLHKLVLKKAKGEDKDEGRL